MRCLKSMVFLMIGIVLFLMIQSVLTANFSDFDNISYIIKGFKALEKNTVEVLYLGSSVMECGISPMNFYRDTGICSYSLATSAQPLSCSYFLLREAFKTQSPSVVVLDASALFIGGERAESDNSWRFILDNLNFSLLKLEMAEAYEKSSVSGDKWNALLPIIKYHTRWAELMKTDFIFSSKNNYYSAGQYIIGTVSPSTTTEEVIRSEVDYLLKMEKDKIRYIEGGIIKEQEVISPLYDPEISDYSLEYLIKINQFCEDRGAKLVLTKIPAMRSPTTYGTAWTEPKYRLTKTLAEEYGLVYLDLKYDMNVEIDFSTDTLDGGIHLNGRGAEKTTLALEEYLLSNYNFKQQINENYNIALEKFEKVETIMHLQSEMTFEAYIENLILNLTDWTILISVKDDYISPQETDNWMTFEQLEKLNLKLVKEGKFKEAYLAVIQGGDVLYEAVSNRRIDHREYLKNTMVDISSSGGVYNGK